MFTFRPRLCASLPWTFRKRRPAKQTAVAVPLLVAALSIAGNAAQKTPAQQTPVQQAVQQSMSAQQKAQLAIQLPLKVDVVPMDQGKKPGEPVKVQIVLQDGQGKPVGAIENTNIELTVTQPSGKASTSAVQFNPGESSKTATVIMDEPGASLLTVRQANDRLVGSTNYVLVSLPKPARPSRKKTVTRPRKSTPGASLYAPRGAGGARLVMAAFPVFEPPVLQTGEAAAPAAPQLMLKVSGEDDAGGVRADGTSAARVQVFYISDAPPPSGVRVWLQVSHGVVTPNPLIISRDSPAAEASWTSKVPVDAATVLAAVTNPPLSFQGPSQATVRFVQPILGIDFVNPPETISIVDRIELVARFFGPSGAPIQTSVKRQYRFASNNAALRLNPESNEVNAGTSDFSTQAVPTAIGICNIEASTPGYRAISHKITVTGATVLILCLAGGFLGSLAAYINTKGKLWMRIVSGIIVALVASWFYVYVGLPKTDAIILHSQLSVLFVSILASFGGVKVLQKVSEALKFGF